ncbi:MAG: alpha/beta hydrolase [Chloroflexi bacterium]|nr:alpha/beta hydrolase [Chloroflexota bacterium]
MAKTTYGIFKNSIPYARVGSGKKTLLLFIGGPGNGIPRGLGFSVMISGLKSLLAEYTLYAVSRKSALQEGYTTRMMSDDYAELIRQEFDGHVELVVGISYGGMIAQHFAADHADLCDHLVIAMATHKATEEGVKIDLLYADLASQGKDRQAGVAIAKALYPSGMLRGWMSVMMWLLGPSYIGRKSSTYSRDVLIEAKAEETMDTVKSLKRIKVPVLLLDGEKDGYFQAGSAQEMAAMIPGATLILYPGKGHEISSEKRFGDDIMEFVRTA